MYKDREIAFLQEYGATDIEPYNLISNYGYTFNLDGVKCDIRYWANCYGCALNSWQLMSGGKLSKELTQAIESHFNNGEPTKTFFTEIAK